MTRVISAVFGEPIFITRVISVVFTEIELKDQKKPGEGPGYFGLAHMQRELFLIPGGIQFFNS